MKKKSSIIKLSIIGVVLIIGMILSFVPMNIGMTTYRSFARTIKLGLDLKGGVYAVYEMDEGESTENISSRMEGTRTRLENLLIKKGYTEATVVRDGQNRIRVEVPDVDEPSKIFNIIGKPAELRFEMAETKEQVITGNNVTRATAMYDSSSAGWVVSLELDSEGTEKFANATRAENQGKAISIIITVDGDETVISSPKVNDQIVNGKAIITGMESQEAAQSLADQIASGQFEVKLSLLESSTVSPTLGGQALRYSIIAGIVGIILVMAFMSYFYRLLGAVASFSLLLYSVMMLFLLSVIPGVQLTLPGIAGLILSIGMAIDANVIIYERIKEEYKNGKSILASYYAGFKRALWPILDSNVTTVIAGIVLYIFGSGPIKGFAITLLIGISLSFVTSIFISRAIIKWILNINSTNDKLYKLKRGEQYKDIDAGSSDKAHEEQLRQEQEEKARKKALKEGATANETI